MEEFKTQDIVLAASLKYFNYTLNRIERAGSKGIFVFESVTEQFIQDYDLGKIKVEPVAFNNNIKQLTTSVRRMLRQP